MWLTKYNILIILCLPILLLFLIRIYDNYKRGKISTRGLFILLLFWLILTLGILFNQQIFDYLENSNLISSTPLSLYDVIQITSIIFLIYLVFRLTFRNEELQNKLSKLNQEIALKNVKDRKIK
jgi:hypothetical protein